MKEADDSTYFSLNLHKADLDAINRTLIDVELNALHNLCQQEDDGSMFAELVRLTTLQICYAHAPYPSQGNSSNARPKISRPRRILYRKKRKLKAQIRCLKRLNPDSLSLPTLEHKVNLMAYEIQQNISMEIHERERKAVQCVKKNPKYFFSYAKRFSKLKSNIGPLRSSSTGTLQHDAKEMAEILQDQYSSVFSDPDNEKKKDTTSNIKSPSDKLTSFNFS